MQKQNESKMNGCKIPEISLVGNVSIKLNGYVRGNDNHVRHEALTLPEGITQLTATNSKIFGTTMYMKGLRDAIESIKSINCVDVVENKKYNNHLEIAADAKTWSKHFDLGFMSDNEFTKLVSGK